MIFLYYAVGAVIALAVVFGGFLIGKKIPLKLNNYLKCLSYALIVLFFFRFMTGKDAISDVNYFGTIPALNAKWKVVLGFFEVWLSYSVVLLAILAPFFNFKTLPALVAFFGLPSFIFNFATLFNFANAIVGENATSVFNYRTLLLALETSLGLGLCVIYTIKSRKNVLLRGKEWVFFAFAIAGMLFASVEPYYPKILFDATKYQMKPIDLNYYHRLLIYPAFVFPVVLYLIFCNKSEHTKRFAMLYYSWGALIMFSFSHKFADFAGNSWVTSLPLHLCNTALYVTPLCLTFRLKKLFYFTYFINVLGAFCAITMPDTGDALILSSSICLFYLSHYQAFFMPLLLVGLGEFRRPRWKEFKYSMVSFVVYFVLMLIINAWFTNYNPDVNYFFLNNDFIPDKFGSFGMNLLHFTWEFDIGNLHFKFYPLYQFLFFLVYFGAAFGMWFLYELGYNVVSGWQDVARRNEVIKVDRLALESRLEGRSLKEPVSMENTNKLVLKHFTKRYAKSSVYAVKDANLEVVGGEIYGFLGPNGAGKSTIIKSIVGIQTITDGAIEVCGYDVALQSVEAKMQIGYVPDHYALYEKLTAREYINYIADLYEVSKEDREERLNKYIKLFEFETAIDNQIKTYSHGMKQKVTIMSALIHNPKVWILDEPLTGLDPNSIFQVKECMKQHAKEGNIVFFSSHIIDVVERICDKIAIIRKGQIQCVRNVRDMEEKGESLEAFYMETINGHEVEPVMVEKGA